MISVVCRLVDSPSNIWQTVTTENQVLSITEWFDMVCYWLMLPGMRNFPSDAICEREYRDRVNHLAGRKDIPMDTLLDWTLGTQVVHVV